MKILYLAPHPFYQDRGTPIAVDLALKSLSAGGHSVDVVTYHEGSDVSYPNVRLFRIRPPPFIRNVRPGFSLKKLVCDVFLFFRAWGVARRNRPEIIHAGEEAVFIAWFLGWVFRVPYIYDMDSSLPDQIVEKMPKMRFMLPFMRRLTKAVVCHALLVAPVCDALAEVVEPFKPRKVVVLRDVSLLPPMEPSRKLGLRDELRIEGTCFMYVGNLEGYQGIDLLLESFSQHSRLRPKDVLVIVGGTKVDIDRYRDMASTLGVGHRVHFLGPKPIQMIASYLSEADVLVSPRVKGNNTPMKLYSYLDSGKAVLATDLPTHTQILDHTVAFLAPPRAPDLARAMLQLSDDPALRAQLGYHGQALIQRFYTYGVFDKALNDIYHFAESQVGSRATPALSTGS